jgi:hypothetical protein
MVAELILKNREPGTIWQLARFKKA